MLFSATQTTKVEDLARISLRPKPLYINVDANMKHSTVETLEQGYVVCEADKRFLLLFSFLRRYAQKKIIVFFSSCQSVKYHGELLNFIDIPVLDLHVVTRNTFLPPNSHRENKNKKNGHERSLNLRMQHRGHYSAQTSPQEVLISPLWTGSFSMTLLTIHEIISTVLAAQLEAVGPERDFSSCSLVNSGFCIS